MPEQALTATSLPTLDEIRAAGNLVYSVMAPTPQIVWPLLCERLGAEVWVKHENHTPIGAFKARTAIVYAAELFRGNTGITGLVTATRGNHGNPSRWRRGGSVCRLTSSSHAATVPRRTPPCGRRVRT